MSTPISHSGKLGYRIEYLIFTNHEFLSHLKNSRNLEEY